MTLILFPGYNHFLTVREEMVAYFRLDLHFLRVTGFCNLGCFFAISRNWRNFDAISDLFPQVRALLAIT